MLIACWLLAQGCSVSVTPYHADDTKAYRDLWRSDWTPIIAAARGWAPSGGQPGACNRGGSGCYTVDQRVLPLLAKLVHDLEHVDVPPSYRRATQAVLQMINIDGQGISDRDAALRKKDDALFAKAVTEIHRALSLMSSSYALFPASNRPTPVPFGGPGHYAG